MIKTFTENDLIRFLYNELSKREAAALEQALVTDTHLQDQLEELQMIICELEKVNYSPSERSVHRILDHSRSFHGQSV
ncbi:MAG: hypothetical protein JXR10_02380 [Cyclobacteriaceae bacterium]